VENIDDDCEPPGHRASGPARVSGPLAMTSLTMMLLLSACGPGAQTAASATQAHAQQVQQTCQQVSAVLGDGPDPGADPIGHAQAQILPLEQVHAPDETLSKAISALASAYRRYIVASGTGQAAKSALTAAINRINSLCPGAGAAA
jgi:hypothetical protein